jgi:hypothetical protein
MKMIQPKMNLKVTTLCLMLILTSLHSALAAAEGVPGAYEASEACHYQGKVIKQIGICAVCKLKVGVWYQIYLAGERTYDPDDHQLFSALTALVEYDRHGACR